MKFCNSIFNKLKKKSKIKKKIIFKFKFKSNKMTQKGVLRFGKTVLTIDNQYLKGFKNVHIRYKTPEEEFKTKECPISNLNFEDSFFCNLQEKDNSLEISVFSEENLISYLKVDFSEEILNLKNLVLELFQKNDRIGNIKINEFCFDQKTEEKNLDENLNKEINEVFRDENDKREEVKAKEEIKEEDEEAEEKNGNQENKEISVNQEKPTNIGNSDNFENEEDSENEGNDENSENNSVQSLNNAQEKKIKKRKRKLKKKKLKKDFSLYGLQNKKMDKYNGLKDSNLQGFFCNKKRKKHLYKMGLITKNGYIINKPEEYLRKRELYKKIYYVEKKNNNKKISKAKTVDKKIRNPYKENKIPKKKKIKNNTKKIDKKDVNKVKKENQDKFVEVKVNN